jgi:hypothetical protein
MMPTLTMRLTISPSLNCTSGPAQNELVDRLADARGDIQLLADVPDPKKRPWNRTASSVTNRLIHFQG